MPNNEYANEPNQSRSEDIIQSILDNTEYDEEARSRIEYLLIELKNAIEGGGGGGGVTSYAPLTEKPKIDNHTLQAGNNTSSDLGLQTKLTFDSAPTENSTNPVTSGGVYTALDSKANSSDVYNKSAVDTALTDKADKSTTYTKSEVDTALGSKQNTISDLSSIRSGAALGATAVQPVSGKGLSTNDYTTTEKTKLAGIAEGAEVNEIEGIKVNNTTINPDANKTVNITVPTSAADVSALPASTKYAAALSLTINSSTYVMTGQLKDQNGDNLGTAQPIDLPLESVVVGGSYNSQTKKVVLTLQNGNTVEFSVADLVSGLQTELSESNKLNPAYINYDSTHRAVSDTEKSTWNSKQNALSSTQLDAVNSGIDSTKVEQIETNKNNILLVEKANGAKNLIFNFGKITNGGCDFVYGTGGQVTVSGTKSGALAIADIISNEDLADYGLSAGDQIVVVSDNANVGVIIFFSDGTTPDAGIDAYNTTRTITIPSGRTKWYVRLQVKSTTTGTINETVKPMICTKALYDLDNFFVPYAMSNIELTAKEQVNENNIISLTQYGGGINKFQVTATTTTVNGITFTVNADKTITATGSIADSSKNAIFTMGTYTAVSGDVLSEGFTEANSKAYVYARGGSTSLTTVPYRAIAAGDIGVEREYACAIIANTVGQVNITFKPMICNSDIYAKSGVYQPYALSNVELTAKEQVNENNISSVQEQANWNTNNCVKNISPYNNGTTSTGEGTVWNNLPIDIPAGTYSVSFLTDSTNSAFVLLAADGTTEILRKTYSATNVSDTFTISTAAKFIRLYIGASKTVSNFMIHSFGDNTFVPYAMSNAELTAAIQALQAQLANE